MSQEDNKSSPTATGGNLTSKFLRKTKFRRASVSHSETEFIPGLSNPSDNMEVDPDTKGSPVPVDQSHPSADHSVQEEDKSPPTNSDIAPMDSYEDEKNPTTALHSLLPKLEIKSPTLSSLPSQANSPPESTVPDAADSIASSPRSTSPDIEIKPPNSDTPGPTFQPFSPEELDQAKTLVLDLLGWGVDPEYLVTSGVSPEIIFRIFNDLNLRLPKNLEVSEELKALAYSWGPPPDFSQSVD